MANDIYYRDYLSSRIISFNKEVDDYDRIYYKTNENLVDLYKNIDFKGKRVLSVLSSSDHMLTARYNGAFRTETFDMNRLTIYYYYLRKWSILYMNSLYPKIYDKGWMYTCLKRVQVKDKNEDKALEFFWKHMKDRTDLTGLFHDIENEKEGKIIYSNPKYLKSLYREKFKFYNINLFNDIDLDKEYDIVLISNILDWARNNEQKLEKAHENLTSLVKPDGLIVCSHLVERPLEQEKEIFEQNFEFNDQGHNIGYVYKRTK